MSTVNRQVEVDRGRMVWNFERDQLWSMLQKCGGQEDVVHELESSQMEMGRRLLESTNTVAGVAVQGDLGWRKWRKGGNR